MSAARRRSPTNAEIAERLQEMALFLDMEGVAFKPRAYEKAAQAVASYEHSLASRYRDGGEKALEAVPTVGKGIAERIAELLDKGKIEDLERLRADTPVDVLALTRIEGLGPKHVRALHEALGVRTLADLEAACRAGRVRDVPHFGEKSEQKILRGLGLLRQTSGRHPIGDVWQAGARDRAAAWRSSPVPSVWRSPARCGGARRPSEISTSSWSRRDPRASCGTS